VAKSEELAAIPKSIPVSLKLAAGYLIFAGALGLVWPLFGLGPSHAAFESKPALYQLGAHTRDFLLNIGYMVAGAGLFARLSWAPLTALGLLAISTFFTGSEFAWGFAGEEPSSETLVASVAVVGSWNTFWGYIIYRSCFRQAN